SYFQAPPSTRTRRADQSKQRRPTAPLPPRSSTTPSRRRLDGDLRTLLGRRLRPPGRLPPRAQELRAHKPTIKEKGGKAESHRKSPQAEQVINAQPPPTQTPTQEHPRIPRGSPLS